MLNQVVLTTISVDDLRNIIDESVKNAISFSKPSEKASQENDDLIKINDVCRILHVSKVTIHAWKKSGKLPFYRISNKVYFKKAEVMDAMRKIERKAW
jgi:excisionase family DNA binding protein